MELETEHIFIKPEINIEVDIQPYIASQPEGTDTTIIKKEYQTKENVTVKHDNTLSNIYKKGLDNEESFTDKSQRRMIQFDGKVYENGRVNRLQCPECDNTFKNRANLKAHLKFVHSTEEDVVECDLCFRTFKSLQHLRSHKTSVHIDGASVVCCEHCEKTFPNKKKLNNHVFYCHPEPEQEASCDVCGKTFKTKYRLKIHMKQVHPMGEAVSCSSCQKQFKNSMLLQRHARWAHPADGMQYRCQECGRMLPSIDGYKRHMAAVHGAKRATCCVCGKDFKSNASLLRHAATVHAGNKLEKKKYKPGELACTQCDKRFSTNTGLAWHFEKHHSENKMDTSCHLCCKDFCDSNNLKRHMDTVHSMQSATCDICFKTYKSPMNLQRHVRITHAPPEAAKTCEICNKIFKCSMHLKIHNNVVHSKDGDFACNVCNKVFSSKKYMIKHAKTHNSKEFPCNLCHKLFKSLNDVKRHIRRVHMKRPDGVFEESQDEERVCMKCDLSFEDDEDLHSHIISCGSYVENITERSLQIKIEVEDELLG